MPRIASIVYTPNNIERKPAERFARVAIDRANLIKSFGIEGDLKGATQEADLNIMLADDVAALQQDGYRTAPGELGEQIIIDGMTTLPIGAQLRLGPSAVVSVNELREPCGRFEKVQGHPKEQAIGRIGFMARVITGGPIAVGDQVHLL